MCFLDVQKAFDSVWHNGLFVKLYEMGIRSNLLRLVMNMYKGMKSAVLYKGYYSAWFSVLQGTWQGGVMSPFFYLCFINDLISELIARSYGFIMSNRSICSPAVADDMLLMALSKLGLDGLMRICFSYACKWRYEYGPPKSAVVVFNESKGQFLRAERKWFLGTHRINEEESYKYLGVYFSKYLSVKGNIKEASDRLKGTFVSLVNSGIVHENGLHPLSCQKIYRCIVLPKALYGCENWSQQTETDILTVERAHRYCIKYMQGLHIRTRTAIALSLIGAYTVESEIDFKKLILFGQFCSPRLDHWLRFVFLNILTSFSMNGAKQTGYIPDIVSLLRKYNLLDILETYKKESTFPSKLSWKKLVKCRLQEHELRLWHNRISNPEFSRFRRIHGNLQTHSLWLLSKQKPKLTVACRSVIQMLSNVICDDDIRLCYKCGKYYHNVVDHIISECSYLHWERVMLWDKLYQLSSQVYEYLRSLDKITLTTLLLGEDYSDFNMLLPDDICAFWCLCLPCMHVMWVKYTNY